jgi:hypothetical protein
LRGLVNGLVLTLAVLVGFDQGGGALLDHLYERSSLSPVVRITQAAPENLIVGSSTANRAIDPQAFLLRTYNAAEDGQGIFYMAALLRALPDGTPIRRIVIGIDPGSLISGFADATTKHLWRLGPLAASDPVLRDWLVRDSFLTEIKLLSRLFAYRSDAGPIIRRWLRPSPADNGFTPLDGALDALPDPVPAKERAPRAVAPEAGVVLDIIAAEAVRLNAQIVTVTIPVLGGFDADDPAFAAAYALMSERLSAVPHCDLTSAHTPALRAVAATPAFFSDGAHFNGAGARAYSEQLAQLIASRCPSPTAVLNSKDSGSG